MSLQSEATHWFESYVRRDQTLYALEALAATGQVELEQGFVSAPLLDTQVLQNRIQAAERLARQYAELLPAIVPTNAIVTDNPERIAGQALACIRNWLAQHLRRRRQLSRSRRRLHDLRLLRECCEAMGDARESLLGFCQQSPFLDKRIYACPKTNNDQVPQDKPRTAETYVGPQHRFHVVACLPDSPEAQEYPAWMSHCETVKIPAGLVEPGSVRPRQIEQEIRRSEANLAALELRLAEDSADPQLTGALNDLAVLRWYLDHTITLTEDREHCRLTGWTSAASPEVLQKVLHRADIDATVLFRPAPMDRSIPVDTRSTSPFWVFVNMFGIPGAKEVDPTPLLAILVPVLFGFMFSAVGHGLVLAATGLALSFRYPNLRFLMPCGLAAAGFGILFGETIGSRDVVPALWLHPLDEPLVVLFAPLGFGVAIILLGLALSGIEAHRRDELRNWIWLDGGVLVLYASSLVGLFHPPAFVLAGLALAYYLVGSLATCRGRRWGCLARNIGRLLQSVFELALNTFSFLRVGPCRTF